MQELKLIDGAEEQCTADSLGGAGAADGEEEPTADSLEGGDAPDASPVGQAATSGYRLWDGAASEVAPAEPEAGFGAGWGNLLAGYKWVDDRRTGKPTLVRRDEKHPAKQGCVGAGGATKSTSPPPQPGLAVEPPDEQGIRKRPRHRPHTEDAPKRLSAALRRAASRMYVNQKVRAAGPAPPGGPCVPCGVLRFDWIRKKSNRGS